MSRSSKAHCAIPADRQSGANGFDLPTGRTSNGLFNVAGKIPKKKAVL